MAGRIKSSPSDFIVQEALDFGFDGQGEHLYIHVRKCALNTNDVIENLQIQFQCRSVDIGVSGLKDKHAITDQWFSVRTPKDLVDTDLRCVPQKPLSFNRSRRPILCVGKPKTFSQASSRIAQT